MDRSALLMGMLKRVTQPRELVVSRAALSRFAVFPICAVAVVTSGGAERPAVRKVIDQLGKSGAEVTECVLPDGEPTPTSVASLTGRLRDVIPQWIVAVGGGRVIDAAKLAWAGYEHPTLDFVAAIPGDVPPMSGRCSFAAVPTTAGSGAEASAAAVVTHEGRKIPWVSHHWVPSLVILDPEALKGIPLALLVETGLDALTHALEAYVSRVDHPLARRFAAEAATLLLDALPRALAKPDDTPALEALQYGAYLAGLAQSAASTGLAHALSHAAGAALHVPHARATAAMLLPSLRINRRHPKADAAYEALAKALHLQNADDLFEHIQNMIARAAVPSSLSALAGYFLEEHERRRLASLVALDPCLRTNVVPVTGEAAIQAIVDEVS